jgi:hypothetical protein
MSTKPVEELNGRRVAERQRCRVEERFFAPTKTAGAQNDIE